MGKVFLTIFFYLFSCINTQLSETLLKAGEYAYSGELKDTLVRVKKANDTVFILQEPTRYCYHKVFIEKNRKSEYYNRLTDFKFDKYDIEALEINYLALKEKYPGNLKKHNTFGLSREWLRLHKYRNKFYLYAPSDWGNAGRRVITDSALIYWYMDGPYMEQLEKIERISAEKYKLTSRNFYESDTSFHSLIIHMIDNINKIAVWEYPERSGKFRYELFIAKEKAKNFEMVVNYCDRSKVAEFDFDSINYNEILNNHKLVFTK